MKIKNVAIEIIILLDFGKNESTHSKNQSEINPRETLTAAAAIERRRTIACADDCSRSNSLRENGLSTK